MTRWKKPGLVLIVIAALVAVRCGQGSPATPTSTPITPSTLTLTAPAADSPADNAQLTTLRPTLTVKNGTSTQPNGSRTYDFQISDSNSFSTVTTSMTLAGFAATVSKTGVAEDPSGKTSFQVESDLQPATVYYWRARLVQGWRQQCLEKRDGFGRDGESKLVGGINLNLALVPAAFGLDCLIDGQGVEEFVCKYDARTFRHLGQRGMPEHRDAGTFQRLLLLCLQHWADLDQMNHDRRAEFRHDLYRP